MAERGKSYGATDRFFIRDFGLRRLSVAFRSTVTWLVVVLVLIGGTSLVGVAVSFAVPGMLVTSIATMSLGLIPQGHNRWFPIVLLGVSGSVGVAAGTVTLDHPVATFAAFLGLGVVVLLASVVGSAGTLVALGGVGGFYAATLIHAEASALPLAISSCVIGAALAAVVLEGIFRETRRSATKRTLRSLKALARGVVAGRVAPGALGAAVTSVRAEILLVPAEWPGRLADRDGVALQQWQDTVIRAAATNSPDAYGLAESSPVILGGDRVRADSVLPSEEFQDSVPGTGGRPLVPTAVQLLVAAVLSLAVSLALDPYRWIWCVLAALIMLFGTTSTADSLGKGVRRVAGTAIGLPVGVLLAAVTHDDTAIFVLIVVVAMFLQQYFSETSYGLSIFFLTVLLSVLYGRFDSDPLPTLVTRLELTALGAAIGVLVALFVLPARTAPLLLKRADDALASVEATLVVIAERRSPERLDRLLHEAEKRFVIFQQEARAAQRGWPLSQLHARLAQQRALGTELVSAIRELVQELPAVPPCHWPGNAARRLEVRIQELRSQMSREFIPTSVPLAESLTEPDRYDLHNHIERADISITALMKLLETRSSGRK